MPIIARTVSSMRSATRVRYSRAFYALLGYHLDATLGGELARCWRPLVASSGS
jgi:hypothetical protein